MGPLGDGYTPMGDPNATVDLSDTEPEIPPPPVVSTDVAAIPHIGERSATHRGALDHASRGAEYAQYTPDIFEALARKYHRREMTPANIERLLMEDYPGLLIDNLRVSGCVVVCGIVTLATDSNTAMGSTEQMNDDSSTTSDSTEQASDEEADDATKAATKYVRMVRRTVRHVTLNAKLKKASRGLPKTS